MGTWVYFEKLVHGHVSQRLYKYFVESKKELTSERLERFAERWGDETGGGHNSGYTVNWKIGKHPPKDWFIDKCQNIDKRINHLKSDKAFYTEQAKKFFGVNWFKKDG